VKPDHNKGIVVPRHHGVFFIGLARNGCRKRGMVMADDLAEAIRENASGPLKAAGDSGSMEQHTLEEQIAADKYLESKKAVRRRGIGIALKKIVPPGTD
jgi:hypothetical protein